ncbi:MAG: hypothetical protein ACUVT9_05425 [Candidatus Bathycorpusculaceae bacterium]
MSAKNQRFKPKRRELTPVRRNKKGDCVKCENYEPVPSHVCLWKLEAQIDKASQHLLQALSLMRKITAKQRQLVTPLIQDVERSCLKNEYS